MKAARLPRIVVSNRQRKIAVDSAELERFAHSAVRWVANERGRGLTTLDEVAVLLISDRRIAELHQRFMEIPGPTDVITFQHGEIFISVETGQRQAEGARTSLVHELQLYLLHGLLHLRGFDDDSVATRTRMHAVQEQLMARWQAAPG